jgi:ATP-dependent metalloprotease
MVTRLGFSPKLGNVDLGSNYKNLSSETKQEIEAEVRRLVTEASERATALLKERRNELELVTKALIEYETLTKAEIEKILRGEKLDKLESLPKAPITLPDSLLTTPIKPKSNDPVLRDQDSSERS